MKNAVTAALVNTARQARIAGRTDNAAALMGALVAGKFDTAIAGMLKSLAKYADDHAATYGAPIGSDYVLGDDWRRALASVRGLLNGERGRLDGGDADRAILAMFTAAGFEGDEP